jgi:hypothetical protein
MSATKVTEELEAEKGEAENKARQEERYVGCHHFDLSHHTYLLMHTIYPIIRLPSYPTKPLLTPLQPALLVP